MSIFFEDDQEEEFWQEADTNMNEIEEGWQDRPEYDEDGEPNE